MHTCRLVRRFMGPPSQKQNGLLITSPCPNTLADRDCQLDKTVRHCPGMVLTIRAKQSQQRCPPWNFASARAIHVAGAFYDCKRLHCVLGACQARDVEQYRAAAQQQHGKPTTQSVPRWRVTQL